MKPPIAAVCLAFSTSAQGLPRAGEDYTIPAESANAAGNRAASADYTHDGNAGDVSGISTAAGETAKHGYIGQLYEPAALQLSAPASTLPERGSILLGASLVMDDATRQPVVSTTVAWSVLSGPLSGIDATGLASAGPVYQNSAALAQGAYAGFTGTLALTVLDTIPDNFGTYAGDGLGDAWQVQFFGIGSPDAGPLLDPDGDGQENRFEFIAGLIPTDPRSFFSLAIEPVAGEPLQRRLVFSPCLPDRNYQVLASTTLLPDSWFALTDPEVSQTGDERTVIDTQATGELRFYRVEVAKP